jgi:phage shock protein A
MIVKANVNDLVERGRSPEEALDRLIGQLDRATAALRDELRQARDACKQVDEQLNRARRCHAAWVQQADDAAEDGDAAAAADAMRRAAREDASVTSLTTRLDAANVLVAELSDSVETAEDRLRDTRLRRDTLIGQLRSADLRRRSRDLITRFDEQLAALRGDAEVPLPAVSTIERETAAVDAMATLEPERLIADAVEAELATMKAAVAK